MKDIPLMNMIGEPNLNSIRGFGDSMKKYGSVDNTANGNGYNDVQVLRDNYFGGGGNGNEVSGQDLGLGAKDYNLNESNGFSNNTGNLQIFSNRTATNYFCLTDPQNKANFDKKPNNSNNDNSNKVKSNNNNLKTSSNNHNDNDQQLQQSHQNSQQKNNFNNRFDDKLFDHLIKTNHGSNSNSHNHPNHKKNKALSSRTTPSFKQPYGGTSGTQNVPSGNGSGYKLMNTSPKNFISFTNIGNNGVNNNNSNGNVTEKKDDHQIQQMMTNSAQL